MRKTLFKRIVSGFVAAAMTAAMLPAVSLSAFADGATLAYDETKGAFVLTVDGNSKPVNVHETIDAGTVGIDDSISVWVNKKEASDTVTLETQAEIVNLIVESDHKYVELCTDHKVPNPKDEDFQECATCGVEVGSKKWKEIKTAVTGKYEGSITDDDVTYTFTVSVDEGGKLEYKETYSKDDEEDEEVGEFSICSAEQVGDNLLFLVMHNAWGHEVLECEIQDEIVTKVLLYDGYIPLTRVAEPASSGDDGSGALLLIGGAVATGIAVYNAPAILAKAEKYGIGKALAAKLVKAHDFIFYGPADKAV